MNAPVSRREALVVGVSTAAGLFASAAPVPKAGDDKSWIGKTVLPKKSDPLAFPGPTSDPDDEGEYRRPLRAASWEVKAEKGTRVEVVEDGVASWLEKDQAVLLSDAVEFYTKAIKDSDDTYAYNFRGWAKYLLGKPDDAVKDFDKFLELVQVGGGNAQRVVGLSNRGLVLAEMGKFDAAFKDLDAAVEAGHLPGQLNRGWAYELKGEYKKAIDDYATILNFRPADAPALNNMAWLRATCPDAAIRDGKEAVKFAKQVCELGGNREGIYLDTLAAAHAEAGDFAAAIKTQEKALEDKGYARKYGDEGQKRLQLYKSKKPYRSAPLK